MTAAIDISRPGTFAEFAAGCGFSPLPMHALLAESAMAPDGRDGMVIGARRSGKTSTALLLAARALQLHLCLGVKLPGYFGFLPGTGFHGFLLAATDNQRRPLASLFHDMVQRSPWFRAYHAWSEDNGHPYVLSQIYQHYPAVGVRMSVCVADAYELRGRSALFLVADDVERAEPLWQAAQNTLFSVRAAHKARGLKSPRPFLVGFN